MAYHASSSSPPSISCSRKSEKRRRKDSLRICGILFFSFSPLLTQATDREKTNKEKQTNPFKISKKNVKEVLANYDLFVICN